MRASQSNNHDVSVTERILHLASIGDLEGLKRVFETLDDIPSKLLFLDKHQSTPLHYAAGNGHEHVCRFLLDHQCLPSSVDATSSNNGRTALHWAARNGHAHVCQSLVTDYQANVDYPATGQVTPLQLAIWQGHLQVAQVLVQHLGADPTYINHWGCGVAHWMGKCPRYAREVEVEVLVEEASSINRKRQETHKILFDCCDWLFQDCRVPFAITNHHGQTPLHKAAFAGNLPVLQYFVHTLGMLDDVRDDHGNSATDCAERSKCYEIARWLRRHASPLLLQAMTELGLHDVEAESRRTQFPSPSTGKCTSTQPPPLTHIRAAFFYLAKTYHPDRRRQGWMSLDEPDEEPSKEEESQQYATKWNQLCHAYRLLTQWWDEDDDQQYDFQVRILSRNVALMERPQIMWIPSWHKNVEEEAQKRREQERQERAAPRSNQNHKQQQKVTSAEQMQALQEFETRLVRLLLQRTHSSEENSGLPISQLPKEYEKNWHCPVPKPKDYGCRKLVYLILKFCPNIQVEYGPNKQQAWLRVGT